MSNINPDFIEEEIRKSQEKKNVFKKKFEFDEKNYLNTRLNKGEVSRQIRVRLLPVSAEDGHSYVTLHSHTLKVNNEISKSGFKSFICLNDEHIKDERGCPLCDKYKEMMEEANRCKDPVENKALFVAAKQYEPREIHIARVIERGHEEDGVKFWRFNSRRDGQGIKDFLLELYKIRNQESIDATGEPYNIFDLENGKDIIITLGVKSDGKTSVGITDAGFSTPLSKDPNQVEEWVNDEKTWQDVYASKSYEYLEIIADGEIPYYDKENNKWVAKVEKKEEIGEEDTDEPEPMVATTTEDDDLPF